MERLYGVREGRPEKLPNISAVTQSDLATQLGMSVDTLQNYKMLADMIPELERLYGIKNGGSGFYGNRHTENIDLTINSEALKTQEQLAQELGMSVDTLQNYKMLADMIPELERLYGIEHGGYRKSKLNNSVLNNSQSDLASPQKNVIIYLFKQLYIVLIIFNILYIFYCKNNYIIL